MKGIGDLMKQASQMQEKMQEKMQEMQAEIAALEITGESGAGLVQVIMNGRHEVKRVNIDPSLMSEEKEILEDLIAAACNDAAQRVEAAQQEKMAGITSGLGLPFGKMPF